MESHDDDDACAAAIVLNLVKRRLELTKRARRRRLLWTQPWISSRLQLGAYHALLDELRTTDAAGYRNFLRIGEYRLTGFRYLQPVPAAGYRKTYIVKPYAVRGLTEDQRIFNYRLSRARRVVENAFGILGSRFRIFGKAIPLGPHKVQKVVMAACCLHNFLMRDNTSQTTYVADLLDSSDNFQRTNKLSQQGGNRSTLSAHETRDKFCKYFNSSVGAVSWQQNICI